MNKKYLSTREIFIFSLVSYSGKKYKPIKEKDTYGLVNLKEYR